MSRSRRRRAAAKRNRMALLKWSAIGLVASVVLGFIAFLYLMPPFFLTSPDTYGRAMADAAPPVGNITDATTRAIAERGRYIVMTTGCTGCHATNGSQGPDLTRYLAGGGVMVRNAAGTFVSRNLTPDPDTGLSRRSDQEVTRVLRSGTFPDGHVAPFTVMPWASFSNWTEEERFAVLTYLRHVPPEKHEIPPPVAGNALKIPGAIESFYAAKDYGVAAK